MPYPVAAMLMMFSRMSAPDLLAHATRSRLLARVEAKPGATVGELRAALDVDYKTLVHHARALERGGHLVVVKDGRARRCFSTRGQASSEGASLGGACPPSRSGP